MVSRPPKSTSLRNRVFCRILRENRGARLGCRRLEEPKKTKNTAETKGVCIITHAQKRNPFFDLYMRKFRWRSVKGFLSGGGQIFPFPIGFHRRPYTTLAQPCDYVIYTVVVTVEWTAVLRNSCVRIPVRVRRGRAVSALPQLTGKSVAHSVQSVRAALSQHLRNIWSWRTGRCVWSFRFAICLSAVMGTSCKKLLPVK